MAEKRSSVQVNLTEHHNADYISSCFKMIGSTLLNLEQNFRLRKMEFQGTISAIFILSLIRGESQLSKKRICSQRNSFILFRE